jgi:dihydroorotase
VQAKLYVSFLRKEMDLFTNKIPLRKRKLLLRFVFIIYGLPMMITKGNLIMESSCKTANDRKVLWEALLDGRIDMVTDHALIL